MTVPRLPRLYAIDAADCGSFTDFGVGIQQRPPSLTAQQRALVRWQLEHGACLAAFDARVHAVRDVMRPEVADVLLLQTDDLEAVPGLRP